MCRKLSHFWGIQIDALIHREDLKGYGAMLISPAFLCRSQSILHAVFSNCYKSNHITCILLYTNHSKHYTIRLF